MKTGRRWAAHLAGTAMLVGAVACNPGAGGGGGGTGLVGHWNGFVENLQFASGSSGVLMTIASASGTTVTGTVLFGDGTLLPPPTSASEVYPAPNLALYDSGKANSIEGFRYTIQDTQVTSDRLRIQLALAELWGSWCQLQTPVMNPHPAPSGQTWWCGPAAMPDMTEVQAVCTLVCACTESACTAVPLATSAVSFDLVIGDGALDGSVAGLIGGAGDVRNVHLTPQ